MNNDNNTTTSIITNGKKCRYQLASCFIYHPLLQGKTLEKVYSHFLVDFVLNKSYIRKINKRTVNRYIRDSLFDRIEVFRINNIQQNSHPFIRNFYNIFTDVKNSINYDIVEIFNIIDENGHEIRCCIKKTCFLKIFQRKCRNYLNRKKIAIQNRFKIESLKYRETRGRWSRECYT